MSRGVILGHTDLHEGPPVTIRNADAGDIGKVLGNLREHDEREALAMMAGTGLEALASACACGMCWAIELHGNVVACFGYVKRSMHVVEGWSFGTEQMVRVIPAMTRFIREELPRRWIADGIHVVEVRAMVAPSPNHVWLTNLGFVAKATLEDQGGQGENFVLYYWRRPFVAS